MNKQTTIDENEIEKFSKMADEWWDPEGKFKPLHLINPLRLQYILEVIKDHFGKENNSDLFTNIKMLDVGCGGGLVSIPLKRLGANITAIDAGEKNIMIAKASAKKFNVEVDFRHTSIEELGGEKYDVILALEIIEHVANVEAFIEHLAKNLKENGLLILSTINRTPKSYLQAIVAAEYILRWTPIGTHEFNKFLKPSEIESHLSKNHLKLTELKGLKFNPRLWEWNLSDDVSVNYFLMARKGV